MAIRRHLTHIKSSVVTNGKPKLPKATDLLEGEIAINFATDHETIAIKNASGDIVTFSSDNVLAESYSSATEVNTALQEKLDTSAFTETTEVIAAAINQLDDDIKSGKTDVSAFTQHTGDTTIHHTHSNKAYLDTISGEVGTMAYEDASSYSSATEVSGALENKLDVTEFLEATETISTALNQLGEEIEDMSPLVEVTYADLVALRNASGLTPGQQYRITDYVTTTVQENTQSAGHQFDIIVTADDESHLNEVARAILHSGDTYFSAYTLEAWELKYCLDNDTNRFTWADTTNGKGVIYYMKDEFNNECGYDFKNVQYKRWKCTSFPISVDDEYLAFATSNLPGDLTVSDETDFEWRYTIDGLGFDMSLASNNITIKRNYKKLNNIVFSTAFNIIDNVFIGFNSENNTFYGLVNDVNIGNSFNENIICDDYDHISCVNIGAYANKNFIYGGINNSWIGDKFQYNKIYNISNSVIGNLNNNFSINSVIECCNIGCKCHHITFEGYANNIVIGAKCSYITINKAYIYNVEFKQNQAYITLTSNQTTSSSNRLRNIIIDYVVYGSSYSAQNPLVISHNTLNDTFQTIYQPVNTKIVAV